MAPLQYIRVIQWWTRLSVLTGRALPHSGSAGRGTCAMNALIPFHLLTNATMQDLPSLRTHFNRLPFMSTVCPPPLIHISCACVLWERGLTRSSETLNWRNCLREERRWFGGRTRRVWPHQSILQSRIGYRICNQLLASGALVVRELLTVYLTYSHLLPAPKQFSFAVSDFGFL